jgi:hypothetical protein
LRTAAELRRKSPILKGFPPDLLTTADEDAANDLSLNIRSGVLYA